MAIPDGQTLLHTTDPSVLLQHIQTPPYGSTGVADMAWLKAARKVGRNYTEHEIERGWPVAMEPHRLACLQFQPGHDQSDFNAVLVADCKSGKLKCTTFTRHDYAPLPGGGRELIETWTDYAIAGQDFCAWLAGQGMEPSPHLAAWFKAQNVGGAGAAAETAPETQQQRQDRRLQACIAAGLPMGSKAVLLRLPDGVGALAISEGVSRQTFTADVKAALQRRASSQRQGA